MNNNQTRISFAVVVLWARNNLAFLQSKDVNSSPFDRSTPQMSLEFFEQIGLRLKNPRKKNYALYD